MSPPVIAHLIALTLLSTLIAICCLIDAVQNRKLLASQRRRNAQLPQDYADALASIETLIKDRDDWRDRALALVEARNAEKGKS